MREALQKVKAQLGTDAVILGTRTVAAAGVGRVLGATEVEIAAAPAPPAARPGASPSPAPASPGGRRAIAARGSAGSVAPADALFEGRPDVHAVFTRLVQQDVAAELARRLVERIAQRGDPRNPQALTNALRELIAQTVPTAGGIALSDAHTRRVAMVGPAGAGKTTTVAKLAAHFKLRANRRVALLSLDLQRLAAHEQLARYAEIVGVPIRCAQSVMEVKDVLASLPAIDLLLIDTPGIGLRDRGGFARLAALLRAARPDETHLVLPATFSAPVHQRAVSTFAGLGITRAVLTRLDDAVGLGVILGVLEKTALKLSYLSNGQKVPTDLQEACGAEVAALVLPPD